jgi:type II restriction/modification system DNA methylase subunit YeeA
MNKSKLKSYAPTARRDFIRAVTERSNLLGLSEKKIEPVEEKGDVAIIAGRAWPRKVAEQRKGLDQRIEREDFGQVMEAVAYTWFNRLLALRYMELHDYLGHGFRVLSHPGDSHIPEILEQAAKIDLPGLDKENVIKFKLDGSKDAELYRMLLIAQCNALHKAMPFLFEKIDDETELLLPENLLHSDSLVRKLVKEIDEEDWKEVEIIGWMYQFYISEKKDQVIGKVVKSEDIPAATQLFTPNWIVKYMVQNSLGRKWLITYPESKIKAKIEYYIEPAEQTEDVNKQLKEITPESLNPEEITVMDPACGSGHILVEAYELFKEIYLERGYRTRDIPRLILEKNLYGLDIDERAAQMAGFALLMKARVDDRRILSGDEPPKMNVMAIQEVGDSEQWSVINEAIVAGSNNSEAITKDDIKELLDLYKHGKSFGSLIQIPEKIAFKLKALANLIESNLQSSDIFIQKAANTLLPFVRQSMVLAGRYNCVVANPPYMGNKFYDASLKKFIGTYYDFAKGDLYTSFIVRNTIFANLGGLIGMITIPNWMFLSSFESLRDWMFKNTYIETLCHNGRGVFGSDFGSCSFTVRHQPVANYIGSYKRLFEKQGSVTSNDELNERFGSAMIYKSSLEEFKKIPGSPVAYWLPKTATDVFLRCEKLEEIAEPRQGMATSDVNRFIRYWFEVSISNIGFGCKNNEESILTGRKWFPHNKGGEFRRWYGNNLNVVNWQKGGRDVLEYAANLYGSPTRTIKNISYYFKPNVTWSLIGSCMFSARVNEDGFTFDVAGPSAFPPEENIKIVTGFLNSAVAAYYIKAINPTLNFNSGDIARLPFLGFKRVNYQKANELIDKLIQLTRIDWDALEISWDFDGLALLKSKNQNSCSEAWAEYSNSVDDIFITSKNLEEENNRLFIGAYGLDNELSPDVPEDQITLARADREEDFKRLISYAIGCMMGRYSLDEPGLIYAHSGNEGFDQLKYKSFPADDDGIVPSMDMEWFDDDAAVRFENFIKVAWSHETLEESLKFIAESLSTKKGEAPRDTIRRYFSNSFFKDHLKTYKKRPIYWLFSSGKLKAFECLVYLHRYNESTLSRMRNEYVTPLQGKFTARADYLQNEIDSAASASERNKLQKQLDILRKKQAELKSFDDELRHYADQRLKLDLDDGVKVNYGKFGNLLAEVNAITGKKKK